MGGGAGLATPDVLGGVLRRLSQAAPAFAALRLAQVHLAGEAALAAQAGGAFVPAVPTRSSAAGADGARAIAEILRVHGVADLPIAQRRHDADRRVLRALLEATAVRLGDESLARMDAVLDHVDGVLVAGDGPAAAASGPALDRFARALSTWLVQTSSMPYPALREDRALLRSAPTGAPPPPEPAQRPGGVPRAEPDPEAPWDAANRGVPDWRPYGERWNPDGSYPAWLFGQDDPLVLRRLLVDPEVGGFAFLPVVGRFRSTVAVYEALRLPVGERRAAMRALVGEVRAYLAAGRDRTLAALRGGASPEWATLLPLLRAAVATWFDPAADRALTDVALAEVDAIVGWTTVDVVAVAALAVGMAAVLVSMGTAAPAVVGAVTAVAAATDGVAVGFQLGALIARRADAAVLDRFAEIDAALRPATSPDEIDHEIALTVAMVLLPPLVRHGGRVVVRGVSRRVPSGLADAAVDAAERRGEPWMRDLPAGSAAAVGPTAPAPAAPRPAANPPAAVPPPVGGTPPPVPGAPRGPAGPPAPRGAPGPPAEPRAPEPPAAPRAAAPDPPPVPPSSTPAPDPAAPRTGPGNTHAVAPQRLAAMEADNAAQSARTRIDDGALDAEVEDAFAEAAVPPVRGGRRPTAGGVRVPTARGPRLDETDIARHDGESLRGAVQRVARLMRRTVSGTPLHASWARARAEVLRGRTVEDLGRAGALDAYNRVRDRFWDLVRADPAARAFVEGAGFVFGPGRAPLLRVRRDGIPLRLRRVSLDHSARKAVAENWRRVLDADNLVFEFQDANSLRESLGVALDLF